MKFFKKCLSVLMTAAIITTPLIPGKSFASSIYDMPILDSIQGNITVGAYYESPIPTSTKSLVIGVDIERELRRKKISKRLKARLEDGMIEEIKDILSQGVKPDDLIYYGLEYKYVTLYVLGQLSYEDMYSQLEIAIHQFAKRQMTWFRGMEKRGIHIHWINAELPMKEKIDKTKLLINMNE